MPKIISKSFALILLAAALSGCKKNKELYAPECELYQARFASSATSATLAAGFSGVDITERGVCYNVFSRPTTMDKVAKESAGAGNGEFVIGGLTPSTTYFVRAFATNKNGTRYSDEYTFSTTNVATFSPMVKSRTTTAATIQLLWTGGVIAPTASIGVCYGLSQDPTLSDSRSEVGLQQLNTYLRYLTDLQPGTTYHARYYVNTGTEVYYGADFLITTYYSTVTDTDGNVYQTVKIGNQEWMASNLHVTRFRDGTSLLFRWKSQWGSVNTPSYGQPEDNAVNVADYGFYYNYQAINDARNLAPPGWRIATKNDYDELIAYAGNLPAVALCANEQDWPSGNGIDHFGFRAMPSGYRMDLYDYYVGSSAHLASSSLVNSLQQVLVMNSPNFQWVFSASQDNYGYAVRCIKE